MIKDKFFAKISFLTVFLVVLVLATKYLFGLQWHEFTWYVLSFHLTISVISYFIMLKGAKLGGLDFSNSIMFSSAIRLFSSAGVLLAYFYFIKENQLSFFISFFVFYLCYTTFEIITLLSNLRQISDSTSKSDETP